MERGGIRQSQRNAQIGENRTQYRVCEMEQTLLDEQEQKNVLPALGVQLVEPQG